MPISRVANIWTRTCESAPAFASGETVAPGNNTQSKFSTRAGRKEFGGAVKD